jgi:hypothetical protein
VDGARSGSRRPSRSARSPTTPQAAPDPVAGQGAVRVEQAGRDDQVLDRVDLDHAELLQHRREHPVVGGQRAGVRGGRAGAQTGPPDLAQHDRLAPAQRLPGEGGEPLRPPDALHEQRHDPGALVVEQVLHHLGDGERGLVAHRDEVADPDVAGAQVLQHEDAQRAALQQQPDAAAHDLGRHRLAERHHVVDRVDEAEVVGAEQHLPVLRRLLSQALLAGTTLRPRLAEAGRDDDEVADAARRGLVQHGRHQIRADQDVRQVHRPGHRRETRVRRHAVHDVPPRVDAVHRARVPTGPEVGERPPRPVRPVARADQRDATRGEHRPERVSGHGRLGRKNGTAMSGPAMTM